VERLSRGALKSRKRCRSFEASGLGERNFTGKTRRTGHSGLAAAHPSSAQILVMNIRRKLSHAYGTAVVFSNRISTFLSFRHSDRKSPLGRFLSFTEIIYKRLVQDRDQPWRHESTFLVEVSKASNMQGVATFLFCWVYYEYINIRSTHNTVCSRASPSLDPVFGKRLVNYIYPGPAGIVMMRSSSIDILRVDDDSELIQKSGQSQALV